MSYAGEHEGGPHDGCYPPNCERCIVARQEAVGKRDHHGVLHAPNGPGNGEYCVGHLVAGQCTVLVRHCPVLNTPEQLEANLAEDRQAKIGKARRRLMDAFTELQAARVALSELES